MKLAIVALVAFVALGSALPAHKVPSTRGLKEDFSKFIALLPKDQIRGIVMDYLANDAEVQEVAEYLSSDDFKTLIVDVESIAEYKKFLNYLQDNGLNAYYYVSKLHEILGLPAFVPTRAHARRGSGVRGLIDDIKAILPLDDIKALYYETLKTSEAFINFVHTLKGDEFKGIVNELRANPEFQKLIQKAKDHGVDVKLIVDLLNKIFGWGIESNRMVSFGLQSDLQDFLALVPQDKVVAIAVDYLANDAEVQQAFEYLQSQNFVNLAIEIMAIPEYIEFLNVVQDQGLDIKGLLNKIHDALGIPHVPDTYRNVRRGKGLRGLVDDIKAVLPVEEIKALFHEKLANSPDFANLVNFMKGEQFQTVVKALRANPEFQSIIERLRNAGIDVQLILDLLHKIFGWN